MVKTNVVSSFIKSLSSDKRKKTLTVYMSNGSRYRYVGATAKVENEFRGAESKGEYYNKFIKSRYHCKRLG